MSVLKALMPGTDEAIQRGREQGHVWLSEGFHIFFTAVALTIVMPLALAELAYCKIRGQR